MRSASSSSGIWEQEEGKAEKGKEGKEIKTSAREKDVLPRLRRGFGLIANSENVILAPALTQLKQWPQVDSLSGRRLRHGASQNLKAEPFHEVNSPKARFSIPPPFFLIRR